MSEKQGPSTEQILADAEIVATFLRSLVDRGVPIGAATTLAGNYLQTVVLVRHSGQKPDEPWKPE